MQRDFTVMSRRRFLSAIGPAAGALILPSWALDVRAAAKGTKPNFIFIFADDLEWVDLG